MRLINIDTEKLEEFLDGDVPPYAILSHTWGPDQEEISFQDIHDGSVEKTGEGWVKFNGCCTQAAADGLRYIWIDTCCIDKTNSVELGEAINSMFRWYQNAKLCYAYLADVPPSDDIVRSSDSFCNSRWFTRGWTLQELLAPKTLHFYNSGWGHIGPKKRVASLIQQVTKIPRHFLLGTRSLNEASVAQRMSWASSRVTKRQEDIAYCLLGIFGVTMPMIYGEGRQAFFRLQERIMQQQRDDSILAWASSTSNSEDEAPVDKTELVGALAVHPAAFANSSFLVSDAPRYGYNNLLQIIGGGLTLQRPIVFVKSGHPYILLYCYPQDTPTKSIGIPVLPHDPNDLSKGCLRVNAPVILFNTETSDHTPQPLYLQAVQEHEASMAKSQLHIHCHIPLESGLEVVDVLPRDCWESSSDIIYLNASSETLRIFVRLRHSQTQSNDIIIVLDVKSQEEPPKINHHLLVSSRDMELELIDAYLDLVHSAALGKNVAYNGEIELRIIAAYEPGVKPRAIVLHFDSNPYTISETIQSTANISYEIDQLCVSTNPGKLGRFLRLFNSRAASIQQNEAKDSRIPKAVSNDSLPVPQPQLYAHPPRFGALNSVLQAGLQTYHVRKILDGHSSPVNSVAFSPDGSRVVSGASDKSVKIWDTQTGQPTKTLEGHRSPVSSVAFSPDGDQVVSGSRDKTVRIWDAQTGRPERTFEGYGGFVHSVAFSPDGSRVVSGSNDTTIRIWDARTGNSEWVLEGHGNAVYSAAFSPDGSQVVSGSNDTTIRIWDARIGQPKMTLEGHGSAVYSVAFSPNGNQVVSGSNDTTVRIWDTRTGRPEQTLDGHVGSVQSVAFSPSGRQVVSGSNDTTVRIWDVRIGRSSQTLKGHNGYVHSVAFSPDGSRVVSGAHDSTIIIWVALLNKFSPQIAESLP